MVVVLLLTIPFKSLNFNQIFENQSSYSMLFNKLVSKRSIIIEQRGIQKVYKSIFHGYKSIASVKPLTLCEPFPNNMHATKEAPKF